MIYPVLFVIDTSGSMYGEPIDLVNEALAMLPSVFDEHMPSGEPALHLGILVFSTQCKWICGFAPVYDICFPEVQAGGLTNLGDTLREISISFCRDGFGGNAVEQILRPTVVFMTDGQPTDPWERELAALRENNAWYRASTKIAMGLGDADMNVLRALADDDPQAVIFIENKEQLRQFIIALAREICRAGGSNLFEGGTLKAARISQATIRAVKDENGDGDDGDDGRVQAE